MLGIELQQTRVYQEARAEGAIIGRVDGERALVNKLLARKLGNIKPEIQAQVNSLTLDRVESLGEDFLDFTQMSDLTNWLERNG
jgi:predicted transposase YdaD